MVAVVTLSTVPSVVAQLALSRRQAEMLWRVSPTSRRQLFYARLLTDQNAAKAVRLFGLGTFLRLRMLHNMRKVVRSEQEIQGRQLLVQTALRLLRGQVVCEHVADHYAVQ